MDIWHVQLFFLGVFVSDDFTLSPLGVRVPPAVRWILLMADYVTGQSFFVEA